MVEGPKDYPHSSYGAAVGGCKTAQVRLEELYDRAGFTAEETIKVLEADGELSWRDMVRPKLHYMVHGVVLGNEGFVASLIDWARVKLGAVRERAPRPTPMSGICAFRGVKTPPDLNPSPT